MFWISWVCLVVVYICKKREIADKIKVFPGVSKSSINIKCEIYCIMRSFKASTGIASNIWFSNCLVCSHKLVGMNISLIEFTYNLEFVIFNSFNIIVPWPCYSLFLLCIIQKWEFTHVTEESFWMLIVKGYRTSILNL